MDLVRRAGRILIFAALAASAGGWTPAAPEGAAPTEYEVKAAYLYNFARFVQWPADAFPKPDSPFVLAVLGDDPFGPTLDAMCEGKRLFDRPIVIRRVHRVEELGTAHMVFISATEARDISRIAQSLSGRSVLSVGDRADMVRAGAVIGFRLDEDRVRFEVNLTRAEQNHLKISAQLLKVAMTVSGTQVGPSGR